MGLSLYDAGSPRQVRRIYRVLMPFDGHAPGEVAVTDCAGGSHPPDYDSIQRRRQNLFHNFYNKFYPRVYAYIRSRSLNEDFSADVVQKVFEIAWRRFDEVTGSATPDLWIFRITENTCRYERSKFWRRSEILMAESTDIEKLKMNIARRGDDRHSPVERRLIGKEFQAALERFVRTLPGKQREVFQMRMNGVTYEEIGSLLKISAEGSRRRMLRAINAGKQLFSEFSEMLD